MKKNIKKAIEKWEREQEIDPAIIVNNYIIAGENHYSTMSSKKLTRLINGYRKYSEECEKQNKVLLISPEYYEALQKACYNLGQISTTNLVLVRAIIYKYVLLKGEK